MSKYIYKYVTGVCPETNDEEEIYVKYVEIRSIGGFCGYKQITYSCDRSDEIGCSHDGRCPLFFSANYQE